MKPRHRVVLFITAAGLAAGCSPDRPQETVQQHPSLPGPAAADAPSESPPPPRDVRVVMTESHEAGEGWGYEIYIDTAGAPYIRQPIIPAVPGNKAFATRDDAAKVGELVRHKIMNNIMPPSVTIEELDSLGIRR